MKKRIKIDSTLVSFVIILSGFLYCFPSLYTKNIFWDNVIDFFGFATIIKGAFFRMAARGHKKSHGKKGEGLVKTGLYAYVRNPMYLGSFLIGCGFVLLVWPVWTLPLFALLFYMRFNRQMVIEEKYLSKQFGEEYTTYCKKVPRLFPKFKSLVKPDFLRKAFPWDELFNTKEKSLLAWLPVLAFVLEFFQERIVYGLSDPWAIVQLFIGACVFFSLGFWYKYQMK